LRKPFFIFLVLALLFQAVHARWGWQSHRFINEAAVDYLPAEMNFFQDHRNYLSQHAVDPDTDGLPGYYHYIDIDYYPEFFAGTLPHTWAGIINLYGQYIVENNGIVPWVIEWWMGDLTLLMQTGDWTNAWQVAAELGHYVGDSHQALHLTLNYNGQLTGNYGIHSRYETQLMNRHLDEISLSDTLGAYWENPIDSVFGWIDAIYPLVDQVMLADDQASAVDPGYGEQYYDLMWEELREISTWSIELAAVNLASMWYTAWVNAGSPYPAGVGVDYETESPNQFQLSAFPNPFNAQTTLKLRLDEAEDITMRILDLQGHEITILSSGYHTAGEHQFIWTGQDKNSIPVASGIYFYQILSQHHSSIKKLTIIK